MIVAIGIGCDRSKTVLGIREGATENAAVVNGLLSELVERGVDFSTPRLYILDGGKALRDFVGTLRAYGVRPHVAQNVKRTGGSAIDQRTARHEGYKISQRKRPLIEKAFGWMKQTGGMRKTKLRGLWKVALVSEGTSRSERSGGGVWASDSDLRRSRCER